MESNRIDVCKLGFIIWAEDQNVSNLTRSYTEKRSGHTVQTRCDKIITVQFVQARDDAMVTVNVVQTKDHTMVTVHCV